MSKVMNKQVYRENRCCTKVVTGEIASCRDQTGLFPSSYRLTNSTELKPFPEYTATDPKLMTLEQGDKFKGVFEYKVSDGGYQMRRKIPKTVGSVIVYDDEDNEGSMKWAIEQGYGKNIHGEEG